MSPAFRKKKEDRWKKKGFIVPTDECRADALGVGGSVTRSHIARKGGKKRCESQTPLSREEGQKMVGER